MPSTFQYPSSRTKFTHSIKFLAEHPLPSQQVSPSYPQYPWVQAHATSRMSFYSLPPPSSGTTHPVELHLPCAIVETYLTSTSTNINGGIPSSVLSSPAQKTKSRSSPISLTRRPTISPLLMSRGRTSRLAFPVRISIACLGMMACSRWVCSSRDCHGPYSGSALR